MSRTYRRNNYPENYKFNGYSRDGISQDISHNTDGYVGEDICSKNAKKLFKAKRAKKNRRKNKDIDLQDYLY